MSAAPPLPATASEPPIVASALVWSAPSTPTSPDVPPGTYGPFALSNESVVIGVEVA